MARLQHFFIAALALLALLPIIQGQRRGTVRLVRNGFTSSTYSSGRVQIYISRWGHICDDSQFNIVEAIVICHQLGYTGASSYSRSGLDRFGLPNFPILLDDVDCSSSSYLVILQCRHSFFVDSTCKHGLHDVSVTCYKTRIWSSPYDGQIRLQRTRYTSMGLVEVYCNGQWGTVCNNAFSRTDANIVCRQLGYTGAARYDNLTIRGTSSQPIWLNNVRCDSPYYSCLQSCQRCPSSQWHNCRHTEDVTVECEYSSGFSVRTTASTCYPGQRRGTVRLVRKGYTSPGYSSGRVQIYINRWGHICDDSQFATTEATVICHQLGYTGASSYSRSASDTSVFGLSRYPIIMDDVDCSSNSYLVILQCSYSTVIDSNCIHGSNDASVTCYTTRIWSSPYDGQIRLSRALYTSLGLVEVYCNGHWGTVCENSFDSNDANTVCRQLGYTRAARYDHLIYRGISRQPIWFDNVHCAATSYTCLQSCQRCPSSQRHNCDHDGDVTVECEYSSGSSASTTIFTCGDDTSHTRSSVFIGAVVGGVIAGIFVCMTFLTVLLCCIFRYCSHSSRNVAASSNLPLSTTTVVTNTTNANEKNSGGYPPHAEHYN